MKFYAITRAGRKQLEAEQAQCERAAGLDAVVFSVVDGLMLRPQVSRDPASFVRIWLKASGNPDGDCYGNRKAATVEEDEAIRHDIDSPDGSHGAQTIRRPRR